MGDCRRRKSNRLSAQVPDSHHYAACEGLQTFSDSAIEHEPACHRRTRTRNNRLRSHLCGSGKSRKYKALLCGTRGLQCALEGIPEDLCGLPAEARHEIVL